MSRSKLARNYAGEAGKTFLFAEVPEERIAGLLALPGVSVEHYAAGGGIRTREVPVNALGIVLFGCAEVFKYGATGRMPMSVLLPGDLFGAAALFSGAADYVASIEAEKSTWILSITEEALLAMMRAEDRVMQNYLRYLTSRIRFLSGRIDTFAEWDTEERLMRAFRRDAECGVFRVRGSMTSLAESISVSRATLYRAMNELEKRGWIRRDGKTIEILKEESI